jgi:hypothetical protein
MNSLTGMITGLSQMYDLSGRISSSEAGVPDGWLS